MGNFIAELKVNADNAKQYMQMSYELRTDVINGVKEYAKEYECDEIELITAILYTIFSGQVQEPIIQIALAVNETIRYIYGEKSTAINDVVNFVKNANKDKKVKDYISIAVKDMSNVNLECDIIYIYDRDYGILVEYNKERISTAKLQELNEILIDILEG